MSTEVWRRAEIDSPCIRICMIHPETQYCLGCRRSLDEISRWSSMTPEERQSVLADLPGRNPAPTQRRGGAAARLIRRLI